ncbi:Concanavalin A-like lectin/glucanases superfamily protein [uncultured archaeon]|nr:Concanavalin A-like lectin/glucanases superfamily protein [uncultured archaeon]
MENGKGLMMERKTKLNGAKKGIVLTLDMSVALLLLFTIMLIASAFYSRPAPASFSSGLLRTYLQDASSVMSERGYFYSPLGSPQNSNTTGMREVMRGLPDSVCMQVNAYGNREIISDGLLGYWNFENMNSTMVPDESGNGHNAAIQGVLFPGNGEVSDAAYFSGRNYAHTPAFYPGSEFTVSAWVMANGTQAANARIADTDSRKVYALEVDGAGRGFSWTVAGASATGGKYYSGIWQNVVGTYNGTHATLYINGVQASSVAAGPTVGSSLPVYFGTTASSPGTNSWAGWLDEVRVYNRALSAPEIQEIYANPPHRLYTVEKEDCPYTGGVMQSVSVPFLKVTQDENVGDYAIVKGWYKGA